jgi:enolase-phosphatase E1
MPRAILLDIEGTTTPIKFVYDVLFPFARRHAKHFLAQADVTDLKNEHDEDVRRGDNPPEWSEGGETYINWLMDQDRKSTALKRIQGEIWQEGYRSGELKSEVFPDVPAALRRWRDTGIDVRIFSSGSVLAQRLLFSNTAYGDLTKLLNGFFDTTTGPKNDSASYAAISRAFALSASDILFVSDVTRELDAAREAGMDTRLCIREGNYPQPANNHKRIQNFESV